MNLGPPSFKPLKNSRYNRVDDKQKFDENYEKIFGKRTVKDVQQGRRHKKTYILESDSPFNGVK